MVIKSGNRLSKNLRKVKGGSNPEEYLSTQGQGKAELYDLRNEGQFTPADPERLQAARAMEAELEAARAKKIGRAHV